MTLLVTQIDGPTVWMIADSAITGGELQPREREYGLKVAPSRDGRAIIGYAGDQHHGTRVLNSAASTSVGASTVSQLLDEHRRYPSVDFAYAFSDETGVHLFRISEGTADELTAFHLGQPDAFDHFQRIRHATKIDFAPEAVKTFFTGARAPTPVPETLNTAISSMLRLMAERSERDVGGWVTPYFLTDAGAFLCGYGYSVSDPILNQIGPGASLPHGTPEAGGFGLSLTEISPNEGVIVYWLQQPGGLVFLRTNEGYTLQGFQGRPAEFIQLASQTTGKKIQILFSEKPAEQPEVITVMRDENGIPSMAIAKHGDTFSFSVLNVGSPFRSRATTSLSPNDAKGKPGGDLSTENFRIKLSDDKDTATINLNLAGNSTSEITLTASELDLVIAVLGEARAVMKDQIPYEPAPNRPTAQRETMVLNPTWRTDGPIHPTLAGVTLRLRHTGFGWVTFLLPWHEAKSLGKWLVENSEPKQV
jgi:hypothetical protein